MFSPSSLVVIFCYQFFCVLCISVSYWKKCMEDLGDIQVSLCHLSVNEDPNDRGCTPEFSCSKAQKIVLVPRTQPKLCDFLPNINSHRLNNSTSPQINPCDIIIATLLGHAHGIGNAVAGGHHLRVPLRSQNRKFATHCGEKIIAKHPNLMQRWQFFCCHQQKCPHTILEGKRG
jgi:hypothetical protein